MNYQKKNLKPTDRLEPCDQLANMLYQIVLLGDSLSSSATSTCQASPLASSTLTLSTCLASNCLRQHVNGPTHANGNTLDLILSHDEQFNKQLISNVAVQSMCFSDHHLLTCRLGVPLPQAVTATFTFRLLRRIDMKAFCLDILQSVLFCELNLDADGYADLFDAEVKRVLDIHAPLRSGRRRCGQHDSLHRPVGRSATSQAISARTQNTAESWTAHLQPSNDF